MRKTFAQIRKDGGIHGVEGSIASVEDVFDLQGMGKVRMTRSGSCANASPHRRSAPLEYLGVNSGRVSNARGKPRVGGQQQGRLPPFETHRYAMLRGEVGL